MGEWLMDLASFLLSEVLFRLREKNRALYILIMGGFIAIFAGVAVLFYSQGAPVKGTVMALFALLMLVLLVYTLRKDPQPARRTWNSWYDKKRSR